MRLIVPFILIITLLVLINPAKAQVWHVSSDAGFTMTQNSYSDNWDSDETGAISWTFNSNSSSKKRIRPWLKSKNTLRLLFGQTASQDSETRNWSAPLKSNDLIDFETVFSFPINFFVSPYVSGRIESHFDDPKNENKRFFDPVVYSESTGFEKAIIDEDNRDLNARIGFGLKQGINRQVLVDSLSGKRKTRYTREGGLQFVTDTQMPIHDNIFYKGRLTMFKALFSSRKDEQAGQLDADYWKEIDINWENTFTASITKYLIVNLDMQLLYDKEVNLAGRLKQTVSLGLTYILI